MAMLLRLGGEDERRGAGGVELADVGEAGFAEPGGHFGVGEGVAGGGVDEHGDGEDDGERGAGAVVVGDELGDDDGAAGGEGVEDPAEQLTAAVGSFAVEDVAEGGDVVAGAEGGLEDVSFDEMEAVCYAIFRGVPPCYG